MSPGKEGVLFLKKRFRNIYENHGTAQKDQKYYGQKVNRSYVQKTKRKT